MNELNCWVEGIVLLMGPKVNHQGAWFFFYYLVGTKENVAWLLVYANQRLESGQSLEMRTYVTQ